MTQKQEIQKLKLENVKLKEDNSLMRYAIYISNKVAFEIK